MAQITISGLAIASLYGQTVSSAQTFTVDASEVSEQVSRVFDTYTPFIRFDCQVIYVANQGSEDVLMRLADGSNYLYFAIPPDGHILFPANGKYADAALRSATSAGCLVHIVAIY